MSYLLLRLRLSGYASGIVEVSIIPPLECPAPLWRLKGLSIARVLLLLPDAEKREEVDGATGGGMDGKKPKSFEV